MFAIRCESASVSDRMNARRKFFEKRMAEIDYNAGFSNRLERA